MSGLSVVHLLQYTGKVFRVYLADGVYQRLHIGMTRRFDSRECQCGAVSGKLHSA